MLSAPGLVFAELFTKAAAILPFRLAVGQSFPYIAGLQTAAVVKRPSLNS
jgi:hypothetical protein